MLFCEVRHEMCQRCVNHVVSPCTRYHAVRGMEDKRKRGDKPSGRVIPFRSARPKKPFAAPSAPSRWRCPAIPKPPKLEDPRQGLLRHVAQAFHRAQADQVSVSASNTTSGFRASAADLGALQDLIRTGLAGLDEGELDAEWDEVEKYVKRVVRTWVQRVKRARVAHEGLKVRVELVTQDDRGFYDYAFEVLLG